MIIKFKDIIINILLDSNSNALFCQYNNKIIFLGPFVLEEKVLRR